MDRGIAHAPPPYGGGTTTLNSPLSGLMSYGQFAHFTARQLFGSTCKGWGTRSLRHPFYPDHLRNLSGCSSRHCCTDVWVTVRRIMKFSFVKFRESSLTKCREVALEDKQTDKRGRSHNLAVIGQPIRPQRRKPTQSINAAAMFPSFLNRRHLTS